MRRVELHPVRLRFDDPELERAFLADYESSGLRALRVILFLVAALYVVYALLDLAMTPERLGVLYAIRVGVVVLLVAIASLTWHPRWLAWQPVLLPVSGLVAAAGLIAMDAVTPPAQDLQFAGGLAMAIFGTLTLFRLRFRILIWVAVAYSIVYMAHLATGGIARDAFLATLFLIPSSLLLGGVAGWNVERYARRAFLGERAADRLLRNVLPDPIAERLMDEPGPIADDFPAATILFADIVDFSELSTRMDPDALVAFLNEVFTAFDRIVDRRGIEKIKTIGDAYMAVAGVPVSCADHVERILTAAEAMVGEAKRRAVESEVPFRLRVGVATGPVVAGVIGEKNFAYDLWGEPVTLASRMESHGVPDRIQVTRAVVEAAGEGWGFEPRGEIQVKGHGPMETWLVTPPRAELPPPSGPPGPGARA